jgi:predicted TIM-barrel fold metal-dependent hydrolase
VADRADRLVAFSSVHPLRDYAVAEVARCAGGGAAGLKLHFTNSRVDPGVGDHVARLRETLGAANALRLPILIHLRTADAGGKPSTDGAADVDRLVDHVLPAPLNVPLHIAHLGGWDGYDRYADAALAAFIHAFAAGRVTRSRVHFDVSAVVLPANAATAPVRSGLRLLADQQRAWPRWEVRLVARVRALGLDRALFRSDWPFTPLAGVRGAAEGAAALRAGRAGPGARERRPLSGLTDRGRFANDGVSYAGVVRRTERPLGRRRAGWAVPSRGPRAPPPSARAWSQR